MEDNEKRTGFIWKGPRIGGVQEEIQLDDCDLQQLQQYYDHCQKMLYNNSPKTPGRMELIAITTDQIQRCRAELLVRWLREQKNYTYSACHDDIRTLVERNKAAFGDRAASDSPVGLIMSGIPDDYARVPIGLVTSACMYMLGVLDTSHITLNFLTQMGIYLTQKEMQETLFERDPATGRARNRLEVIKEREGLNPALHLEVIPTGLTYAEFHEMCRLRKDRYEKFTTPQLKILADKVLYRFQLRCEEQADQWRKKAAEIEEVASSKGWDIHGTVA